MDSSQPTKKCKKCKNSYPVTPEDQEFYQKIQVPSPTHCPSCRQQRRVAQANQIHLYKRKCDFSGKDTISSYHSNSPYKVYDQHIWFSDKWDAFEYGRNYDFNTSFFEQFKDLSLKVPRPSLQRGFQYDENADYTNYAGKNKNCYLIFDSDESRDCYYSYSVNHCESCMECYRLRKGELCYECVDCYECYNSYYLQDCTNCSDSMFLKNCIGCKRCIACSNIKNKEYYINNEPSSKEEYEKYKALLKSQEFVQKAIDFFEKHKINFPQKFMHGVQNENVIGDYLGNCKNTTYCFDSAGLWDCKYVFQAFNPLKDCMDIQECGDAEQLYECAFLGYNQFNTKFCTHILGEGSDLQYCTHSPHSSNLFGCIGVRHKKYCILNKQYSQEEYEDLLPRIIKHMKETEEYGEFFPIQLSTFPYNETLAQEYFPLTKDQATSKGYKWQDKDEQEFKTQSSKTPDNIDDVDESILNESFACTECGRNYQIIKEEYKLLKRLKMPLPQKCFFCRHKRRKNMRNNRDMFARTCDKCKTKIQTTYPDSRPEKIFCEKCYSETIL